MGAAASLTRRRRAPQWNLRRTLGPHVVEWIEANLVHGPGDVQGMPVVLDREQVAFLFRAYAIDELGRRLVRRAIYSRPKGRAKSEFAAMLCCAEALGPVRFAGWSKGGALRGYPLARPVRAPFIRVCATEEGQTGNTYDGIYFMLREGPVAETPGLDVGLTRVYLPGGGEIRVSTAKAASKDGGRETFAVFDETHLYASAELRALHQTVRRNLAKRKVAEPWALETTTMYAPGEESVAESAHRYARLIDAGDVADPGFLFDHRQAPPVPDFGDDDQLRAALVDVYGDAAEWMDIERLIAEARDPAVDESDFRRYFLNVPTKRQAGQFIRDDRWATAASAASVIPAGSRVCLGADGSRSFDTTVVAWASRASDDVVDLDCRVFSVREDAPHHELHHGGEINFAAVQDFIVGLFSDYEVAEAAYDPNYLSDTAQALVARLPAARIAPVEPSSKGMRDALALFERAVIEGRVRHRGDPVVARHVAAAGVERGRLSGEVRRVYKLDRSKPIDAVIAMALAHWRVLRAEDDHRMSTLEHRDLDDNLGEEHEVTTQEAAELYRARVYRDEDDW